VQLKTPRSKQVAAGVVALSLAAFTMAWLWRRIDQTIDERLKRLMAERVIWKCEGCTSIQLVPGAGDNYQPRNWTTLDEIPAQLIDAVIAVEDRRFYSHPGVDLVRTSGALLTALRQRKGPRGTSTLTQQLSRTLFTSSERTLSRKFREGVFALALECRLSKRQILELYLNTVPFGNAGPFEVVGIADASLAFLGRKLSELTTENIALIVGAIQRPSNLSRNRLEPALARRNLVLKLLKARGLVTDEEERKARKMPVRLAELRSGNAHYLQLAARELGNSIGTHEPVEATLTLNAHLQRAALEAIQRGVEKLNRRRGAPSKMEAALVALDPRTGAIRALVGGTDFLASQVNRALARRQPGSVFKPFVYAAAFEHGSRSGDLGPYSEVNDIPREFSFNGATYAPRNFANVYHGRVTLQQALRQSLNVPAVRLAETVGYSHVTDLAKAVGLEGVAATPSAALGSYEVSPLALAGAYTAFANQGVAVRPFLIERVRDWEGNVIREAPVQSKRVMRAETAQMLASMLRGVVQYGTAWAAGRLPFAAAGKTGTDDDGWFAGFTDSLVCVVWVGYDDNRNLGLEGAKSALPIWMDFMKTVNAMKSHRFANQLGGPPAQMDRAVDQVDPPLPPGFDLQELIASAGARFVSDSEIAPVLPHLIVPAEPANSQ